MYKSLVFGDEFLALRFVLIEITKVVKPVR